MSDRKRAGDPRGEPHWHPLTELPWISALMDEQLDALEDSYSAMNEVRQTPYELDDALVDQSMGLLQGTLDDAWVFDEQLARWKKEELNEEQEEEVERLIRVMAKSRELCEQGLELARELKKGTIDRVMAAMKEMFKMPSQN